MRMLDIDNTVTVEGKDKPIKARDPNAQTMQDIRRSGAAGAHKDKTKVIPRKEKYKKMDEADPAELGPMNDKMKDVLGKVYQDDEAEKQAEIDRSEKIRQQQVKDLGPEAMDKYIDMLKSHDWTYQYSDDHSVWQRGQKESEAISSMMKILDPDMKIYKKYSPFHKEEKTENTIFNALNQLDEVATAGATSAGSIATVTSPHMAIGDKKTRKKYGSLVGAVPNPPKAKKQKPTDNALDMKGTSIFGGTLKRST